MGINSARAFSKNFVSGTSDVQGAVSRTTLAASLPGGMDDGIYPLCLLRCFPW